MRLRSSNTADRLRVRAIAERLRLRQKKGTWPGRVFEVCGTTGKGCRYFGHFCGVDCAHIRKSVDRSRQGLGCSLLTVKCGFVEWCTNSRGRPRAGVVTPFVVLSWLGMLFFAGAGLGFGVGLGVGVGVGAAS
jgi:hypothetical protein